MKIIDEILNMPRPFKSAEHEIAWDVYYHTRSASIITAGDVKEFQESAGGIDTFLR